MNEKFFTWVDEQHEKVGQFYAGRAYSFHTNEVVDFAEKYSYLLDNEEEVEICKLAAKGHDIIEDTNNNYNDLVIILRECGCECAVEVADVIYDVTNELGKNRKERAKKTYEKIAQTLRAVFTKLCDRLANVSQCIREESSMTDKYRREHDYFKEILNVFPQLKPMWDELEGILKGDIQPEKR